MMYKTNGMDEAVTRIEANTSGVSVGDLVLVGTTTKKPSLMKVVEIYYVLESDTCDKGTIKLSVISTDNNNYINSCTITDKNIVAVYKEQKTKTYDLIKALDNEECAEAFFEGFDEGEFEHE